jgi:hypothetical protein
MKYLVINTHDRNRSEKNAQKVTCFLTATVGHYKTFKYRVIECPPHHLVPISNSDTVISASIRCGSTNWATFMAFIDALERGIIK